MHHVNINRIAQSGRHHVEASPAREDSAEDEAVYPDHVPVVDNFILDLGVEESPRPDHVLIVDDSKVIRLKVSKALERAGFYVETAENGFKALSKATANPPDIILMDINMPGMDGWEATRLVRAYPELQNTPVVILSSNTQLSHVRFAIACGAHSYLVKPIKDEELIAHLRAVLNEGQEGNLEEMLRLAKKRLEVSYILVVDDSSLVRKMILRALDKIGCQLIEAKDGKVALEIAIERRPSLVVIDINMPVMGGLAATRRIRSIRSLAETKIIALTENSQSRELVDAIEAGVDDYLLKPFSDEELYERAMHHLGLKKNNRLFPTR